MRQAPYTFAMWCKIARAGGLTPHDQNWIQNSDGVVSPLLPHTSFIRDLVGRNSIYYFFNGSLLLVSNRLQGLLRHPEITKKLEPRGLLGFLGLSTGQPEELHFTIFQNIFSVLPGHSLVWNGTTITLKSTQSFNPAAPLRYLKYSDYAEHLFCILKEVVHTDTTPHPVTAVSLSGGIDSSSLFTISQATWPSRLVQGLHYTSRGYSELNELQYLEALQRRYPGQIKIFETDPAPNDLLGLDEQFLATENPFSDSLWPVTKQLYQEAQMLGATCLLTGHWGDQVFFNQSYLTDLVTTPPKILTLGGHFRGLRQNFSTRQLATILGSAFVEAARERLPVRGSAWLRKIKWSLSPTEALQAFAPLVAAQRDWMMGPLPKVQAHSAHAVSMYRMATSPYLVNCAEWNTKVGEYFQVQTHQPFIHPAVLQFLMSIPGEVISQGGRPRALLLDSVKSHLPEEIYTRKSKADFSRLVIDASAEWRRTAHSFFERQKLICDYGLVDPNYLHHLLDDLSSSGPFSCQKDWMLNDFITLEYWLRNTFDNPRFESLTPTRKETIYESKEKAL